MCCVRRLQGTSLRAPAQRAEVIIRSGSLRRARAPARATALSDWLSSLVPGRPFPPPSGPPPPLPPTPPYPCPRPPVALGTLPDLLSTTSSPRCPPLPPHPPTPFPRPTACPCSPSTRPWSSPCPRRPSASPGSSAR